MPKCVAPSSTTSAFTIPVLTLAGCCREADPEMKRRPDGTHSESSGATQVRFGALGGGLLEKLAHAPIPTPAEAPAACRARAHQGGLRSMLVLASRVGAAKVWLLGSSGCAKRPCTAPSGASQGD